MNVRDRILELCSLKALSINKLAEQSDVTQSTLNSIINNDDPNPQFKTIEKICKGFGITMFEFFTKEDNLDNLRARVIEKFDHMDLNEDQKKAATKIKEMPLDEQQKSFLKTVQKLKSLSAADQEALGKIIDSLSQK